jgi:hypothetical protein
VERRLDIHRGFHGHPEKGHEPVSTDLFPVFLRDSYEAAITLFDTGDVNEGAPGTLEIDRAAAQHHLEPSLQLSYTPAEGEEITVCWENLQKLRVEGLLTEEWIHLLEEVQDDIELIKLQRERDP